jgi:hypothetical protein
MARYKLILEFGYRSGEPEACSLLPEFNIPHDKTYSKEDVVGFAVDGGYIDPDQMGNVTAVYKKIGKNWKRFSP